MWLLLILACGRYEPDEKNPTDTGTPPPVEKIDVDDDGYPSTVDCNDEDPAIHPEADETCNGIDDDCNNRVDDSATDSARWFLDDDGDGYGQDLVTVLACDMPAGYSAQGQDCDDTNAAISPAADEICDDADIDENCNGVADNADSMTIGTSVWYADADNDGYGADDLPIYACEAVSGAVAIPGDCNDADAAISPDAAEVCDGLDNDCDARTDDADDGTTGLSTFYADSDADGYGDATATTTACAPPAGFTADSADCNDADATISPAATEVCDSLDNDCDGLIDDDTTGVSTFYADSDADGYGDPATTTTACAPPDGFTTDSNDCNDADAAISPAATEVCDGLDNDCNGLSDDGTTGLSTFYADSDTDGYGDPTTTTTACDQPDGFTTDNTDCNDTNTAISPAAAEVCDSLDNDCDGLIDDADVVDGQSTFYADSDADGYGDAAVTTTACAQPDGFTTDNTDCNDTNTAISPAAAEVCDSLDNDCDGLTDDADTVTGQPTFYLDNDADGYGDATTTLTSCVQPDGYTADNTDCNDTNTAISPAAIEVCDDGDTDEDCDGLADNADDSTDMSGMSSLYFDLDGDGYGSTSVMACDAMDGYTDTGGDCDDSDASSSPGATEVCDGNDNDCDGFLDEENASGCTTYYYDNDGDGVGRWDSSCLCAAAAPYLATTAGDCMDNDPSATESTDAPTLSSTEWSAAGEVPASDLSSITVPPSGYPFYIGSTLSGSWRADDDTLTWESLRTFTTHTYSEFGINPDNPLEVYRNDGGRLAKSTNGGETWTNLINGIGGPSEIVAVFALNLPEIYVVMQDGSARYSADGGATFENRGNLFTDGSELALGNARRLLAPEAEGQAVFLATDMTLYRSTDGMNTWETLREGVWGPYALARVPLGLVVSTDDGIAVTNDEGDTWTEYNYGVPAYFTLYSSEGGWTAFATTTQIYIDGGFKNLPQSAKAMGVVGERLILAWTNGVMYSDDYGDTWSDANELHDTGMAVITPHPMCDNEVYVASRCSGGVYVSDDYGQSWSSSNGRYHYVMGIHPDPFNPDQMWIVSDNFIARYDTIRRIQTYALQGYHFHGFAAHPDDPNVLFAGSVGSGEYADSQAHIFRSDDGGTTWVDSSTGIPSTTSSAHSILFWPDNPEVMLTGFYKGGGVSHDSGEGIGLYRSTDGGLSWSLTSLPLEDISYLTVGPDAVWASTEDGLWSSDDEGVTWTRADADGWFVSVAFYGETGLAYTNLGAVWRSDDGGVSWYDFSTGLPSLISGMTWLAQIGFSANGDYAYVTPYGYGVYSIAL